MTGTLVWISGATAGLGSGFVRSCPYPDVRCINLSRSAHPDIENHRLDLADPATWEDVAQHFDEELAAFPGRRAVFIHNAFLSVPPAPAEDYPIGPAIAASFETMDGVLTPEQAARDIWAALPDGGPAESVLLFGAPPAGAQAAAKA